MSSIDSAFQSTADPGIIKYLQNIIVGLAPYFADQQKVVELLQLFPQIKLQLNYSFQKFAQQLRLFGFAEAEARKTAADIVLKPLLFSLLPRGLVCDYPAQLFELQAGETTLEQVLERNHISMMGEFGVYLFDQLTDDFNFKQALQNIVSDEIRKKVTALPTAITELQTLGMVIVPSVTRRAADFNLPPELLHQFVEDEINCALGLKTRGYNQVEHMIFAAKQQLPDNPVYYLNRLNLATRVITDDNYTLSSFDKLFSELFNLLSRTGAEPELLAGFIADVITGEHLTITLQEADPSSAVKTYPDFFIRSGLQSSSSEISVDQALAEAILKNQGLTLVMYTALVFSGKGMAIVGLADKLAQSPALTKFMLQCMGLIRLLDDLGDKEIDALHNVINLLNANDAIKQYFMQLSLLVEIPHLNNIVFNNVKANTRDLLQAYKLIADEMDNVTAENSRDLVQAIKAVVFAAFINAQFNDTDALQATLQLMSQ